MQQLPSTNLPSNERGATLVVALIMLILISLIGVSSLKSASTAEKMAAADHQKNITFQASESAAAVSLRDTALLGQSLVNNGPRTTVIDIGSTDTTTSVTYTPVGLGTLLGSSIGGSGPAGQRIMITSFASLTADPNSTSQTVHGVVRLVPSAAQ